MKKGQRELEQLERMIYEVADRALAAVDMPEAAIHFARLQREGHTPDEAKRMIGTVLVTTISLAKARNAVIDRAQIRAELARLPKIGVAPDGRVIDIRGFEY